MTTKRKSNSAVVKKSMSLKEVGCLRNISLKSKRSFAIPAFKLSGKTPRGLRVTWPRLSTKRGVNAHHCRLLPPSSERVCYRSPRALLLCQRHGYGKTTYLWFTHYQTRLLVKQHPDVQPGLSAQWLGSHRNPLVAVTDSTPTKHRGHIATTQRHTGRFERRHNFIPRNPLLFAESARSKWLAQSSYEKEASTVLDRVRRICTQGKVAGIWYGSLSEHQFHHRARRRDLT